MHGLSRSSIDQHVLIRLDYALLGARRAEAPFKDAEMSLLFPHTLFIHAS